MLLKKFKNHLMILINFFLNTFKACIFQKIFLMKLVSNLQLKMMLKILRLKNRTRINKKLRKIKDKINNYRYRPILSNNLLKNYKVIL